MKYLIYWNCISKHNGKPVNGIKELTSDQPATLETVHKVFTRGFDYKNYHSMEIEKIQAV